MTQKPASFELNALKLAIDNYISEYKYRCGNDYSECIRNITPGIGVYNIYGRIVHKRAKGCSYFYELLSINEKKDGWASPCIKMENDIMANDPLYSFEPESFAENIKNIMKLKYFNRIKQFMIRLYHNNLYLGHNLDKNSGDTQIKCHLCKNHKESRVGLFLNCSVTNKLLQLIIRILKKSGCLASGCIIEMFLFAKYPISSIENITLMFTWKYLYNSKFAQTSMTERLYLHTYKGLIAVIIEMSIPLSLVAKSIMETLCNVPD